MGVSIRPGLTALERGQGVAYLARGSIGPPRCGVAATNDDDIAQRTARRVPYRIETLLQDKTLDDHRIGGYQS
jgi:hypothetical protein